MPPELRQQALGEDKRVYHHRPELDALPRAGGGHEAGVEARVVRDYGPSAAEIEEGAHGLALVRSVFNVAVLNARELRYIGRDVHPRVYEGGEGLERPPAREAHRAYLREPVRRGGEAGRLHVEGDELRVERQLALAAHGDAGVHVVHIVALEAVDYLHAVLLPRLAHLGIGLRRAVVGDRDGLHAPGGGALDHLGGVGQGVEGGVARVQVELDALFALMGVRPRLHAAGGDGLRLYDHVAVELVELRPAAHYDALPGLDLAEYARVLALGEEPVDADGAGVVRHVEAQHARAALLNLAVADGEYLALYRDVAALEVH